MFSENKEIFYDRPDENSNAQMLRQLHNILLIGFTDELRKPINEIIEHSKQICERKLLQADPAKLRLAEETLIWARFLLQLLDDLLDLAKWETREVPPVTKAFPLARVIDDVLVELEPLIKRKELSCRVENTVTGDVILERAAVIKIVRNLIFHVVSSSRAGNTIGVNISPVGEEIEIKVFEANLSAPHSTTDKASKDWLQPELDINVGLESAGLGLLLVRKLVEWHGGRIGGDSYPDDSTSLIAMLPRVYRTKS